MCGAVVAECACTEHKKETSLTVCADCKRKERTGELSVRLYGNFLTNGSFGRVSRGLKEGLEDLGLLAGCVEVDEQEPPAAGVPGVDAPVGLYAGSPRFIAAMVSRGQHAENYAIVAPNSSWVPPALVESVQKYARIVAPSTWGAEVLVKNGCPALPPLRHGVSKSFSPDSAAGDSLIWTFADRHFKVLHLSSTDRQRKGTRELITAWRRLVAKKELGLHPRLEIVADSPAGTYDEAEGEPTIAMNFRRINATVAQMRDFYQQHHIVCQPSRAEGFGLVPLESLACGVPIVATDCTGHMDYLGGLRDLHDMDDVAKGRLCIATGKDEPIDDGPDALAPSLDPNDIEFELGYAYKNWQRLYEGAREWAYEVGREWSWANQTELWLVEMGLLPRYERC